MKNKTQYIPLQEATKYCNYSQEYLSLRARQGKLKAMKIGRNWVTKKEWLEEYLNFYNEEVQKITEPRIVEPPENLPIETATRKFLIPVIELEPVPKIRFAFIMALVFVLLIGGVFFLQQVRPKISFEDTTRIIVAMTSKEVRASTIDTFKEYGQWFRENLKSQISRIKATYLAADDFVKKKITQGYQKITQFLKPPEEIPKEKLIPQPTKDGMVVIPYPEKEEEVKEKIKEAFSDEVKVEPKDKTSGIIIPIFREREGQRYLYIMVPVKN